MNTPASLEKLLGYLDADPENPNLLVDCAECCLYDGDHRAREFSERALAIAPDNLRAQYLHGMIELSENAFADAETTFQRMIDHGVNDAAIKYNLAFAKLYLQKMQEVVDILAPLVIDESPQPAECLMVYSKALYHLGNLDETLENLEKYLNIKPDSSECLGLLALAYSDTGENQEQAMSYAQRALAIDPNNHEANLTFATTDLEAYQFDNAREQYQSILQLRPNSGRAWMGMGLTSMGQNDPVSAETELQSCVDNMPQHLGSWNALGWAQIVQNRFDEAEATFNKALEINNLFGESHGGLACIYALTGRTEKAKHAAKLGKRLDPDGFAARFAEVLLVNPEQQDQIQSMMTNLLSSTIDEDGPTLIDALSKMPNFGSVIENPDTRPDNKTDDGSNNTPDDKRRLH